MFIRSGCIGCRMGVWDLHERQREREVRCSKPSKAIVVEAPAGVSLTDAICTLAAMFGGEGVGAVVSSVVACVSGWRCRCRWCFPSLAAPLLKIGSRVRMSVG